MRQFFRASLGLLAAAVLALPARAIVELDPSFLVNDGDYISNALNYPTVGYFGLPSGALSGVLIAPNYVLTAGHVANLLAVGSSHFTIGGNTYLVTGTSVYPSYSPSPLHDDIAVVQLGGSVSNVTPATLYTGNLELTTTATWVGFGYNGTGLTGSGDFTGRGTARAGTNVVDLYAYYSAPNLDFTFDPSLGTVLVADFDNHTVGNNTLSPYSSPLVTSLEAGVAEGDSGGGVFANFGGGNVLIGINDFNSPGNTGGDGTQYGALLGATRVSPYSGWVFSQIPEPGFGALAVGGVVGLIAWRQRRRGPG